jgi:hypothetical protein
MRKRTIPVVAALLFVALASPRGTEACYTCDYRHPDSGPAVPWYGCTQIEEGPGWAQCEVVCRDAGPCRCRTVGHCYAIVVRPAPAPKLDGDDEADSTRPEAA